MTRINTALFTPYLRDNFVKVHGVSLAICLYAPYASHLVVLLVAAFAKNGPENAVFRSLPFQYVVDIGINFFLLR